jgi:hypothetical protein
MNRPAHRRRDRARRQDRARRRRCPICRLPWVTRVLLDLSLSAGASVADLSRGFGISRGALRNHEAFCGAAR